MGFLIALLFISIYFFSTNQIFSFDAVSNAIACERSDVIRWFHPNHLLYPALGALWFRLERLFSYEGYAIYSLARLNSVLVACGLGFFYQGLSRIISKKEALLGSLFLGSTYAVWHYAVDGRAIGTTVLFSSLLIWFLLKTCRDPLTLPRILIVALLSSLYVFSHAIAVFHLIPLAWFLYRRGGLKRVLIYSNEVITLIAVFYAIVYTTVVLPFSPATPLFNWLLGYAGYGGTGHILASPFWANGGLEILNGLWKGWTNSLLTGNILLSTFVGVLFLLGLGIGLKNIQRHAPPERLLFLLFFSWGVLITLFLAVWAPGQEGFRLHVLVPWTAALFIAHRGSLLFFRGVALTAALIFSLNLSGPIYHHAFITNNVGYQLLAEINSQLKPSDILVSGTPAPIPDYEVLRPYFFPKIAGGTLSGWLLLTREDSFAKLKADFEGKLKEGRRIFWTEDIAAPLQEDLQKTHPLKPDAMKNLLASFDKKEAFRLSNGLWIYEITKAN